MWKWLGSKGKAVPSVQRTEEWYIRPYESVGRIRLGMTIAEVREAMKEPFQSCKKFPFIEIPSDQFKTRGVIIHYKPPGICELVELSSYGNPSPVPIYASQPFLGVPFSILLSWFRKRDPDIKVDGSGLTSLKLGIALFADGVNKEPDLPIESVSVFEKDYWAPEKQAIVEVQMKAYFDSILGKRHEQGMDRGRKRIY